MKKSILTLEPTKKDFIQWVLVFNKNDDVLQRSIELIVDNVNQIGRHTNVIYTTNWERDAARRDFSFNAMFLGSNNKI